MDWGSLGGILIALIGILLGQAIQGGHIASLLQPTAFFVVIFGTFGAVLLQTKPVNFIRGLKMLRSVFKPPMDDRPFLMQKINLWSSTARREGILKLESYYESETEPFIKNGLRLMVDGVSADKIREICSIEMHYYEISRRAAAKIWDAAGGYSPTVGILGAVLGLIHVMENLSDPSRLGSGIAVAFVATIYGVGLANIVFLPIGNKLKYLIQLEMQQREMLLNAWVAIAHGEHPRIIEEGLFGYLN